MCPCRNCIVGGRTKWRSGLHLPEIRTVERRQCLMRLREQINMSKLAGSYGREKRRESKNKRIKRGEDQSDGSSGSLFSFPVYA